MNRYLPDHPPRPTLDDEQPSTDPLMEELLVGSRLSRGEDGVVLVGECTNDRHPTIPGRVCVRIEDAAGDAQERWLPTLQGLCVRTCDRVLMTRPRNWADFVVTGVLDGFADRPRTPPREHAHIELKPDERIGITDHRGAPLVDIEPGDNGPVIRLRNDDLELEVPGELKLTAKSIRLQAERGNTEIVAHDDVVVQGEAIRLN